MTVYAIAPYDAYCQQLIDQGCRYLPLKMKNTGTSPIQDLKLLLALVSIYKTVRPDVILHFTIKPNVYGALAAALLSIPVINNVSGLGTMFLKKSTTSKVGLMIYKLAFRFPKRVFFQNEQDKRLFISKKLIKQEIADLLPGSGVDLKKFSYQSYKRNHEFTFLLIARLLYDKGIEEYAQAAKLLRDKGVSARFSLLGALALDHPRGIAKEVLKTWEQTHSIDYLGETSDVRPFICEADCVVLPSYREGTSKSLLEAASLGKPLIATNVPGCNNVVEDNYNGFLCKVRAPEDLAKKMERMCLLNDQELQAMAVNGRNKVQIEFNEEIVITKYLKTIEKVHNHQNNNLSNADQRDSNRRTG